MGYINLWEREMIKKECLDRLYNLFMDSGVVFCSCCIKAFLFRFILKVKDSR